MSLQSTHPVRMSEERLEIIEKLAHRHCMPLVIECCHEIRRLQSRVADLMQQWRDLMNEQPSPRPHPPADLRPLDFFERGGK